MLLFFNCQLTPLFVSLSDDEVPVAQRRRVGFDDPRTRPHGGDDPGRFTDRLLDWIVLLLSPSCFSSKDSPLTSAPCSPVLFGCGAGILFGATLFPILVRFSTASQFQTRRNSY